MTSLLTLLRQIGPAGALILLALAVVCVWWLVKGRGGKARGDDWGGDLDSKD